MLGLDARFDHVERGRDDAGHAACCCCRRNLERKTNVVGTHVLLCPAPLLLVKGELQRGKGQVAAEGGFVAVEEGAVAFDSGDCARGVNGGAVVVARVEVGVVVTALQLQAGFEDFRGDVCGGCGEVG